MEKLDDYEKEFVGINLLSDFYPYDFFYHDFTDRLSNLCDLTFTEDKQKKFNPIGCYICQRNANVFVISTGGYITLRYCNSCAFDDNFIFRLQSGTSQWHFMILLKNGLDFDLAEIILKEIHAEFYTDSFKYKCSGGNKIWKDESDEIKNSRNEKLKRIFAEHNIHSIEILKYKKPRKGRNCRSVP